MASEHHHKEESNLGTGLTGFAIALVWLMIVVYVAHLMALSALEAH